MAKYSENVLNVLTLLKISGIGNAWIVNNNSLDLEYLLKKKDLLDKIKNNGYSTGEDYKNYFEKEKEEIKRKLDNKDSINFVSFKDEKFPLIISSQESPKESSKPKEQPLFYGEDNKTNDKKQEKREFKSKKNAEFPVFLAYKGDLDLLAKKHFNVAVIGLLKPEKEVIELEEKIVKKFRDEGAIIVSGLALGCDTIAHQNAYKEATIAILPSTIENIIPKTNQELANEIAQVGGLLISEYYEEIESDNWLEVSKKQNKRYIDRDRLQAIFSDIVVLTASYTEEDSKKDKKQDSGSRYAMAKAKEYGIKRAIMFDEKLWFDEKTKSQFRLNKQLLLERFIEIKVMDEELKGLKQRLEKQKLNEYIEKISKEEYLKIIKFINESKDVNDFIVIGEKNAETFIKKLKNKEN